MSKISLNPYGCSNPNAGYIGWSPVQLTISGGDPCGCKTVILRSRSINGSIPRVVFMEHQGEVPVEEIEIELDVDPQKNKLTKSILFAGKFQPGERHNGASEDGKDVLIEASWADNPNQVCGSVEVMIRVRKNANDLSDKARNDFLDALATLNGIKRHPACPNRPPVGAGKGVYVTDFVGMHTAGTYSSSHADSHFLPWHRLYLLDLERLLQQVKPEVSLPYWRFDAPAPNLFDEHFLGATVQVDASEFKQGVRKHPVKLASSNPIKRWQIGNRKGIPRSAFFDTKKEAAGGLPGFQLISQYKTLALGGLETPAFGTRNRGRRDSEGNIAAFAEMESTPHGAAHVSFNGPINFVPSAPQDPLFFLLHCNVDRLWALWQFAFYRDAKLEKLSYPYQNRFELAAPAGEFIGPEPFSGIQQGRVTGELFGIFPDYWKLIDAPQWPWDNTQSKPGNLFPPGTRSDNFTKSLTGKNFNNDSQIGGAKISDAIDSYGVRQSSDYLGAGYDDIPFSHDRTADPESRSSFARNQCIVIRTYRRELQDSVTRADEGESLSEATLNTLNAANDPGEIDNLINLINSPNSSNVEKVSAVQTLNIASIFSPIIRSKTPQIVNGLRGIMTAPDERTRFTALSTLASMKDEVAQEIIRGELESNAQEEEKLVPTPLAIAMLGTDEKALPTRLLNKIAENPPNQESLDAAVRHMAAETESIEVLKKIMEDDANSLEVRGMIPQMINDVDANAFLDAATKQIEEKGVNHDLVPFLESEIDSVKDPEAEGKATKVKAMIHDLKNSSRMSVPKAPNERFEDDDSSKTKQDEIWNNKDPHQ